MTIRYASSTPSGVLAHKACKDPLYFNDMDPISRKQGEARNEALAVQHSVNVPMSGTQPLFGSERTLVQYSTICITGSAPLAFRVTLVCIPAPHRPENGNSCHACSIPLCLSHAFIHPESTKRQASLWINQGKYVGLLHANMVDGCTTP